MKKTLLLSMLVVIGFWRVATAQQMEYPNNPNKKTPKNPVLHENHSITLPNGKTVVRCATMKIDQERKQRLGQKEEDFEKWYQSLRRDKNFVDNDEILRIPVVVHVIHNGEAIGTGRNISVAQIQSQINVLNQDFRRQSGSRGFNTNPLGADTKIEFVICQRDPNGLATTGIVRWNRNTQGWTAPPHSTTYIENTIKGATVWDATRYMNIWVADISGGILGYAQFPETPLQGMDCATQPAATDGFVSSYAGFGSVDVIPAMSSGAPYNLGRTATHEIGHYIGLRHIWGDTQPACGDDFCADTPRSDNPNFGCPTGHASCGQTDMIENYMDYTDDACMNIFTKDQKTRMRAVLLNSPRRKSLINGIALYPPATNDVGVMRINSPFAYACGATIAPSIRIKNYGSATLTSATVTYNIDGGANSTFNWTGSLASNVEANVTLTAIGVTTGVRTLNVTVSNPNGSADGNAGNNAISPSIKINQGITTFPFLENFETERFPNTDWAVFDPNEDCNTWQQQSVTLQANGTAGRAAMMNGFNFTTAGRKDELITPLFAIPAGLPNYELVFDIAHARQGTTNDQLQVFISTDCGATYNATAIFDKTGATLQTTTSTADWIPSLTTHWRVETVALSAYAGQNIRLKFVSTLAGTSGNMYVDNVRIQPAYTYFSLSGANLVNVTESTASGTGCREYTDYTYTFNLDRNLSGGNAQVTVSRNASSTAVNPADFEIVTAMPITFASGSNTSQNFVVRVYDDNAVESMEEIDLDFTLNAGTSNAIFIAGENTLQININDNDNHPVPAGGTLFTQNFEASAALPSGWAILTFGGHDNATTNDWRVGTSRLLAGARSAYVSSGAGNYQANRATELALRTPIIDATSAQSLRLSFKFQCNGERAGGINYDYGFIGYALEANPTTFILIEGDDSSTPYQGVTTTTTRTINLPNVLLGQRFHLFFCWFSDTSTSNQPAFVVDDIVVDSPGNAVATAVASTQEYLGPNSTVYFYNGTNELMARIENLSSHDYGCTTVNIDRAGTSASQFWGPIGNPAFYVTNKSIRVIPATNAPQGSHHTTIYYTNSEIGGWETTTTKSRNVARVVKSGGAISAVTSPAPNVTYRIGINHPTAPRGNFGTGYYVQGRFNSGFSGFAIGDVPPAPLPIGLATFAGEKISKERNRLYWTTISETNNKGFRVEKSLDGENFTSFAWVDGAGNSNQRRNYEIFDNQISTAYYRLVQVDIDNKETPTEVVLVKSELLINIYPNPATDNIRLDIDKTLSNEVVSLKVTNILGKNILNIENKPAELEKILNQNFAHWASGLYIFELNLQGQLVKYKMQKL